MTLPDERRRAILAGRELLYNLTVPSKTPNVPPVIRQEALRILKHYPHVSQLTVEDMFSDAYEPARPATRRDP